MRLINFRDLVIFSNRFERTGQFSRDLNIGMFLAFLLCPRAYSLPFKTTWVKKIWMLSSIETNKTERNSLSSPSVHAANKTTLEISWELQRDPYFQHPFDSRHKPTIPSTNVGVHSLGTDAPVFLDISLFLVQASGQPYGSIISGTGSSLPFPLQLAFVLFLLPFSFPPRLALFSQSACSFHRERNNNAT